MQQQRKIMVTSSLPYANGDIHLGHMLEVIQTDIWVRFQKARLEECYYICGSDAHGTPIMLRAEQEALAPEELVKQIREQHIKDFHDFHIAFDVFHSTHSPENQRWTEEIYRRLKENGDIIAKSIQQAYDPEKQMFLPDRFVKGECPRCGAVDQYGDSCELCGANYNPLEMKNPVSVLSGKTPIAKESEHLFFDLAKHELFLKKWLHKGHVPKAVANKLDEWFVEGLQAWDISRDAPYFGFKIPGTENKYFYVWLDAPIGYIASFEKLSELRPELKLETFWDAGSQAELYHFLGKDVVYFHSLFWPALLKSAKMRLPTEIFIHGFLTVNGQKMSKSRGTFIKARTYLNHFDPECLRYYFASKLSQTVEDIDFNFDDFKQKVNSDLIGKLVNIASRTAGFITKHFDGYLSASLPDEVLYRDFVEAGEKIAALNESRQYAAAMREIMRLADAANIYLSEKAPWTLIKDPANKEKVQAICTMALNLFRVLTMYIQAVLPKLSEKVAVFFNEPLLSWQKEPLAPLLAKQINPYQALMTRIDDLQLKVFQDEKNHSHHS